MSEPPRTEVGAGSATDEPQEPERSPASDDAVPITPGLFLAGLLAVVFGVALGLLMSSVSLGK